MKLKWFKNNNVMTITNEEFKVHADHLRQCKEREELETRDVARYLNLAPYYISMALNPKSWDSMSRGAKERIIEFSMSRERIQDFKIPEGEAIWQPAGPATKAKSEEQGAESEEQKAQSSELGAKVEEKKPENKVPKPGKPVNVTPGIDKKKQVKELKEKLSGDELAEKIVNKYFPGKEEKLPAGGNQVFRNDDGQSFRLVLDLEINLIINGRKIQFV